MRTFHNTWRKRVAVAAMTLAAGALLTACHSNNDDDSPPPAPAPAPTPAPPAADSFFTFVAARVAALLDTDEPVAVDSVTATAPDNTEPEAVQ